MMPFFRIEYKSKLRYRSFIEIILNTNIYLTQNKIINIWLVIIYHSS